MKCTRCQWSLVEGSEECPKCGEPVIYKLEKSHNKRMLVFSAVLTVVVLIVAVVIMFGEGNYTLRKESLSEEVDFVYNDPFYEGELLAKEEDEAEEQYEEAPMQISASTESVPVQEERTASSIAEVSRSQPAVASETQSYNATEEEGPYPDWVEEFYQNYRTEYSDALNTLEFWKVEPYLSDTGTAYTEMKEYLDDIKDYGSHFYFYENRINNYYMQNGKLYVETYEAFDLTDRNGQTTSHQRDKIYTMILNYNNYPVEIDSIKITNHYR